MQENFISIKEVALNNNCPECYNTNGLRLFFKQKMIETPFYKALTSEIRTEMTCKTCDTVIYPGQWTIDIDRVVDYQTKAFVPKAPLKKLKRLSWIIIIGTIILVSLTLFSAIYFNL